MSTARLKRQLIRPAMIPVGVAVVTAAVIIAIGTVLLNVHDEHGEVDSLARPELWIALGLAMIGLGGAAFLATRPPKPDSLLDRDVAIGKRSLFAEDPPPPEVLARTGPQGTHADISEGYTLYASNGALATVLGVVPGGTEHGRRFSSYLYARGLYGASSQLWIPIEAVYAVYPEAKAAFLAVKGDETETFGWDKPPESFRRAPEERPPGAVL